MALPKRRGPMSMAQKAALKKAQEISARKRRGTGKIELKKTRPTAKDYRAQGDKIGMAGPARERRTVRRMDRFEKNPDKIPSGSAKQASVRVADANKRIDEKVSSMAGGGRGKAMSASDMRSAKDVIAKANSGKNSSGIKYEMKPGGRVKTVAGKKWHEVTSVQPNGKRMDYWLAKDQGSTRGKWPDELGPDGFNNPTKKSRSGTTSSAKPRGKDTKFDSLSPSEKKKLSGIADMIDKINDDIVGSKNMRYTADGLRTFEPDGSGVDPNDPGNEQTLQDFVDGIDEAIAEMDDLWQGTPKERAARKKLTTLKGDVNSMMLGGGDARPKGDSPAVAKKSAGQTTAKDYRDKGRQMAQKDGVAPGSTARKVRIASRANATGSGGRSGNERTKFDARSGNQTVTQFTPKQRAAAFKKAAGLPAKKKAATPSSTMASTAGSARDPKPMDPKKLRADYIKARDSGMSKAYVDKAKRLFDSAQKESADLNRMMRIDGYLKDGRRPSSIELDWLEEQWRLKKLSPYARKRARAILDDFEKRSATRKWKGETGSPNLKGYSQGL